MPETKLPAAVSDDAVSAALDRLSIAVIAVAPDDPHGLAVLLDPLEIIARWAQAAGRARVAAGAAAVADLLTRIILEDVPAPEASLEIVSQGVTALQMSLGQEGDAAFPPELGLPAPAAPAFDPLHHPAVLPANVDARIFADFLARQTGVLEDLEALILRIESSNSAEAAGELRRVIHTLKGEAGLLALDAVAELCHQVEDAMDRFGPQPLADGLLKFRDYLSAVFAAYAGRNAPPGPPDEVRAALQGPERAAPLSAPAAATAAAAPEPPEPPASAPRPFTGNTDLLGEFIGETTEHLASVETLLLTVETDPRDLDALNAIFRAFHTTKGVAGFLELTDILDLSHEVESLLDEARKGHLALTGAPMELMFDAVDQLKVLLAELRQALTSGQPLTPNAACAALIARLRQRPRDAAASAAPPADRRRLGEILVERGATTPDAVAAGLAAQQQAPEPKPPLGLILHEEAQVPARQIASALRLQKGDPAAAPAPAASLSAAAIKETVKVDSARLDRLVDTIGELVIAEAMVAQAALGGGATALAARHVAHLNKLTRELHQMATALRMVPVRATFERMARVARDLGKKLHKPVRFVLQGEDTELDKSVVDQLSDPLIHMVRNAIDHGIEADSAARTAAGKPPTPSVFLRALHKGGNIYVEIEDDGRGLDRAALLAKAREAGLVAPDQALSESEIDALVFLPGLSTAREVTDVSGRGVGMDVVKRHVEALRGLVSVRTRPGHGSVFTICLPLTLAVIEGMVVRAGGHRYIVPTLSIVRMLQPPAAALSTVTGRGLLLSLEDRLVPLVRLEQLWGMTLSARTTEQSMVVIVEHQGRWVGLLTDEVLGQQQVVVKSLGAVLREIPGVTGGTIMPDGRVGLIVDVEGLANLHGAAPLPEAA